MRFLFLILILSNHFLLAGPDINQDTVRSYLSNNKAVKSSNCARSSSRIVMEINNVRTTLHNGGDMWWTVTPPSIGSYEIPKNDNPNIPKSHSMFAGSIWLGGTDLATNELLVIASTYRQIHYSLFPGPISSVSGKINQSECLEWDQHFKVSKAIIDQFVIDYQNGLINSPSDIPNEIKLWPGKNNPYLIANLSHLNENLAPFDESRFGVEDGVYNPMDGDIPEIKGDESIWWVMNDVGGSKQLGLTVPNIPKASLEIQEMAYAFSSNDPLNDMTFYNRKVLNKGNRIIKNAHLGIWSDPDIGFAGDNYVQCDVTRNLAIAYNGDDFDEGAAGYGDAPPAIGIDIFEGFGAPSFTIADGIDNDNDGLVDESDFGYAVYEGDGLDNDNDGIVDELNEKTGMSGFMHYVNTGNPINGNPGPPEDFYNYLQNRWRNGSSMTYDLNKGTNQAFPQTNYMYPGTSLIEYYDKIKEPLPDTLMNTPWTMDNTNLNKGDHRFTMNSGSFSMEPGAVLEMTYGVPWAQALPGDRLESVAKLKCADDYAQQLFEDNFQLYNGPNAPDLSFQEQNRQITITLHPSDFVVYNQGNPVQMNTETYFEYDEQTGGDFEFQGYKVYQLIDQSVNLTELDDPNKARLISQSDLIDGITTITNYEFELNNSTCNYNPKIMVNGGDNGLEKHIVVSTDAFDNNDPLINNKKYYFTAIAYAYNATSDSLNDNDSQQIYNTYLTSRKNYRVHTVTPVYSNNAMNQNGAFEMEVISGEGNGGRYLNLKDGVEDSILAGIPVNLKYTKENSPLDIRIYNQNVNINADSIEIWLTSRLDYDPTSTSYQFLPGDTIECISDIRKRGTTLINPMVPQIKGKAVVLNERNQFEVSDKKTLEVRLLNDKEGGTFIQESIASREDEDFPTYLGPKKVPLYFWHKGDSTSIAKCIDFKSNDYWNLKAGSQVFTAQHPISSGNNEFIPQLGLEISIDHSNPPGFNSRDPRNPNNGFILADINYSNQDSSLIPYQTPYGVFNSTGNNYSVIPFDFAGVYEDILISSFTYYGFVSYKGRNMENSPNWGIVLGSKRNFIKLQNVDIVLTNDKSKWSRCPVLQLDRYASSNAPEFISYVQKSKKPSIDKFGNPDPTHLDAYTGDPSKGYSWFPGYAIDLDKGIRLNMVFTEDKAKDSIAGNDLLYNPSDEDGIPHHAIILTDLEYDMKSNNSLLQHKLDSVFSDQDNARSLDYGKVYQDHFTWTGMLQKNDQNNAPPGNTYPEMRIKLRVNREYRQTEDGISPKWVFDAQSYNSGNRQAGNQLENVKIVPNPYLFASPYEGGSATNLVKITELPPQCKINIYNTSGALVKSFNRSFSNSDYSSGAKIQEWNLRNEIGAEIGSGVYLIHIDGGDDKQAVKKFFYVRGID